MHARWNCTTRSRRGCATREHCIRSSRRSGYEMSGRFGTVADADLPASAVLQELRKAAEGQQDEDWSDVYLDNARPSGMSERAFRSCLAALSRQGVYRVIDGYAWGKVKMR